MITINRVEQEEGYWYHFPTIDFKFQNRGRATAFLWQFVIEVMHAEIDHTPVLDFKSDVNAGALLIHVANNGWGTADDCHIQLREPTLDLLFSDSIRQYRGTIQSGESQRIFQFGTALTDIKQFEIIKRQFKDLPLNDYDFYSNYSQQKHKEQKRGLSLKDANVSWHCNSSQHKGEAQARFPYDGKIILTESGFERLMYPPVLEERAMSDTTYGAIIDPFQGSYEQKYAISRKISPGDVERFHVMVGSPMSCHLQVRFKFFVDKTSVIESETFDISIWNPRNSGWHHKYTDDKEKLRRYSFYDREETQPDSSVFPLTSHESHEIHSEFPSHIAEIGDDVVQNSLGNRFRRLLRTLGIR